jgi:hypothetical protein
MAGLLKYFLKFEVDLQCLYLIFVAVRIGLVIKQCVQPLFILFLFFLQMTNYLFWLSASLKIFSNRYLILSNRLFTFFCLLLIILEQKVVFLNLNLSILPFVLVIWLALYFGCFLLYLWIHNLAYQLLYSALLL